MNEPSLDLQEAFVTVLEGDVELAQLMGGAVRVYDRVPEGAAFPYIQIADDQTIDNSNTCVRGSEIFARVHVWSREPGHVEAKKISGRVRDLLDTRHTLEDHYITVHQFVNAEHQTDQDHLQAHSVLTFRFHSWEKTQTTLKPEKPNPGKP